jgi:hypothetical protein
MSVKQRIITLETRYTQSLLSSHSLVTVHIWAHTHIAQVGFSLHDTI